MSMISSSFRFLIGIGAAVVLGVLLDIYLNNLLLIGFIIDVVIGIICNWYNIPEH